MISLLVDPNLTYPEGTDFYSPDESFPEYQHGHISSIKNPVYRAVREVFAQAGLDSEHFGAPDWNPLGQFIPAGSRVFLLCNFANERRFDEKLEDYWSRCTHGSVIRAIADYVLIAAGKNGAVRFGNAPTQVCHWQQVLNDTGAQRVLDFYQSKGIPVEACDLRLFVIDITRVGAVKGVERRSEAKGVHVNLGADSLFTALDRKAEQRYRVMNYNPKRTQNFHLNGSHEYVVGQKILESDVILSIPKLKTHEKVGISCALKGFVGTVGHKDSLPHHRYGTPKMGGDEYPVDKTGILRIASAFHERVQQTTPETWMGSNLRVAYRVLKRAIRAGGAPVIEGAWWGNDTAWRMVLDLVRIATYASPDGVMQSSPVRKQLAFIDGIFGGEGEGPAFPTMVRSGVLMFGDSLPAIDVLNCYLMRFDPEKIPLVRESSCLEKYPLAKRPLADEKITCNRRQITPEEAKSITQYQFEPSEGWYERLATEKAHAQGTMRQR